MTHKPESQGFSGRSWRRKERNTRVSLEYGSKPSPEEFLIVLASRSGSIGERGLMERDFRTAIASEKSGCAYFLWQF